MYLENNPGNPNQDALIDVIRLMGYEVYWHITLLYSPQNFFGKTTDIFAGVGSYNILCVPQEKPFADVARYNLKLITDLAKAPY